MSSGRDTIRGAIHEDRAGFRHEALFYSGPAEYVDRLTDFVNDAIDADEPVLVAVPAPKDEMIRRRLGSRADRVRFADMTRLGHNPANIIPAWRRFVAEHSGRSRPLRGVGEPIWAGRRRDELVEAQGHESLLNLALADANLFVLCPYDRDALDPAVIEEARRSHPMLLDESGRRRSKSFRGVDSLATAPFSAPLPEPDRPREHAFQMGSLAPVRRLVWDEATSAGLAPARANQLVLAVNEVATNTLRHAGGTGLLRVWWDEGALICEVRDRGRLDQPMVGREHPTSDQESGRGLWMANQLCDLVQIRSLPSGTVVRLHCRPRLSQA